MKRILMVEPSNYDLKYCINPWMNVEVNVDVDLAQKQWWDVKNRLESDGVEIELMESVAGLPDLVFAANAGMIYKNKALVSNFRDKERQGEEFYFEKWFRANGFDTYTLPESYIWEGEACSVFVGDTLICSYSEGGRAHLNTYDYVQDTWGVTKDQMKFIELIDPYFYHLDVCFCLLDRETVLLCPLAFRAVDYEWIKEQIPNVVEVSYDDALNFNCNAFVHDKKIYFNEGISDSLKQSLLRVGYEAVEVDVSEFVKAGGAVKCLILTLE